MEATLEYEGEEHGTLVIELMGDADSEDALSLEVGSGMTILRLPLYDREAAKMIAALLPLAEVPS